VGKARVAGGAVICRTPNSFPLTNGFRALPVSELIASQYKKFKNVSNIEQIP
jgi:hypothetical protein